MKNKINLKKCLEIVLITSLCFIILFVVLNIYEYQVYTKNFNNKINNIVDVLEREYPNLEEKEIIEILNSSNDYQTNNLKKYGLNITNKSIVKENTKKFYEFMVVNTIVFTLGILCIIILFLIYLGKRNKSISEITKYIEELNKKNYSLKIDSNSEDELSILKNEIYKTTVMLKKVAENSNKDKKNLKKSLEDISHQLKTPITSILIMLDNLIAEPDMDKETRQDFIRDIKRNIININFFVQSILKLSKFDANTIKFIKEKTKIKDIIKNASQNVSTLCDLKNIKLNIKGDNNAFINCDFMWQVEAITNIIKNAVEYSYPNNKIDIFYEQNNVYGLITIRDYGKGIEKEELPHIFERFYKGVNSSSDSIGIGLALAKTIIENDNGIISVIKEENGTKFIIKYFNL